MAKLPKNSIFNNETPSIQNIILNTTSTKNNILSNSFFDFDLFAIPDRKSALDRMQGEGRAQIVIAYLTGAAAQADRDYLAAILAPLHLDLQQDAVSIALTPDDMIGLAPVIAQYQAKYILLFGCPAATCGLRLKISDYEPCTYQGRRYLRAESLEQIRTDREKKDNRRAKALWHALQNMFPDRLNQ